MMNPNEREYRGLMTRIGGSLLIFLGLLSISQTLYLFFDTTFSDMLGEKNGFLVSNLLYAAMYFLSFVLPVAFFRLISRNISLEPMGLAPRLTADTPLLIFASIGVILICSVVNGLIIQPFISPSFDESSMFVSYDYSEGYKVVVQFISVSLVPGICEEFLFRGMILGNLLPYGKTGAVIASSLLFGLMHQNPLQMFYATMAGIVLALLFIYTKSVWCGMLVHILNNGFSVLLEWLTEYYGDAYAWQIILIQAVVFMLGMLSVLLLLIRNRRLWVKPNFENGVFEKTLPEAEGYARNPVAPARKIRLFFAPTIIIFLVMVAIQMAYIMFFLMVGTR